MNLKLKSKIVEKFGSQTRFAFSIGEDESYVSKVVNDWRKLDSKTQNQWAQALGCKVEDIFTHDAA